jgi:hypothetical protein
MHALLEAQRHMLAFIAGRKTDLSGVQPIGRDVLNWAANEELYTPAGKVAPGKSLPTKVDLDFFYRPRCFVVSIQLYSTLSASLGH